MSTGLAEDFGDLRGTVVPRAAAELPRDIGESSMLPGQASTIREMLAMLDTLTYAGQQHNMTKIVALLSDGAPRGPLGISARNQEAVANLITSLRRESGRPLPDIATFRQQTECLVMLLVARVS